MPKLKASVDKALIDLKERLEKPDVTADALEQEAEQAMLRLLVVTTVFKRRFAAEHAKWEEED